MSSMNVLDAGSLFAGAVQMFVAPVDRASGVPVAFDPAATGRFDVSAVPAGWLRVGAVPEVSRSVGERVLPVWSGAPAMVKSQVRGRVEEVVAVTFPGWTRVAIALSSGLQTMNLLKTANGAAANASGGAAGTGDVVQAGSTATALQLGAATTVQAGDVLVVDADYTGAAGYVGSGIAGAYVASASSFTDVDFARRVSFNVARVLSVSAGVVTLADALPAGVPEAGMKACVVQGFTDRNGGSFLQEWSALFVMDGVQGDRLVLHYPRLQPAGDGTAEVCAEIAAGVLRWRPVARMRAMPVLDANDGVAAVCFRSYLPAPMRRV